MKNNIIKALYILVNILFLIGIAAFCFFNYDRIIEFFCPLCQKTYSTRLIYLAMGIALVSYIAGVTICMLFKSKSDELCNAYQKRHENISAQKDNDDAKISALQAKIATLETALQTALKNKEN